MIRRLLALCLLVAGTACKSSSSSPGLKLDEPAAAATFIGIARKNVGYHPYVAVANSGRDEIVLVDPVDDEAVGAPILIQPLSVPVPDPYPALVVSARLNDDDSTSASPDPRNDTDASTWWPDLLVAVSQGATTLQLIRTWEDLDNAAPRDAMVVSRRAVDLGAQVVALVAVPVLDASGNRVSGKARLAAALADGTLAVVDYQRVDTSSVTAPFAIEPVTAVDTSGNAVPVVTKQALSFQPLSLAVDPKEPTHLYAATQDPLTGDGGATVYGVAQLDTTAAPGSWTVRGLDALLPTTLVAAYTLAERNLDARGATDQIADIDATSVTGFQADSAGNLIEVHRVYAWLDPSACGLNRPIPQPVPCGLAVIDPTSTAVAGRGNLLPDPFAGAANHVNEPAYLSPIPLPAQPASLVVGTPPGNAPATDRQAYEAHPYMVINTTADARLTTGVLLAPAGNGYVYVIDLARWEVSSNRLPLTGSVPTGVSSYSASSTSVPQIGFFVGTTTTSTSGVATTTWNVQSASAAKAGITVTPGFTTDESWTFTYQGYLPAFDSARYATVEGDARGLLRVAVQYDAAGSITPTQVVNVYDPTYGIHVGDIVAIYTTEVTDADGVLACPETSQSSDSTPIYPFEGKVTSIEPPDADHPGGSLLIGTADCVPIVSVRGTTCESDDRGPWTDLPNCATTLAEKPRSLAVRIRAGGWRTIDAETVEEFVVVGSVTGYAGRVARVPYEATPTDPSVSHPGYKYSLEHADESALSCPLIPWSAEPPACDATCRATCEKLVLARKARRIHTTSVVCADADSYCLQYFPAFADPRYDPGYTSSGVLDPIQPSGPVLSFYLGVNPRNDTTGAAEVVVRDTAVQITTESGFNPSVRYGSSSSSGSSVKPGIGSYFDRSVGPWQKISEGYRFYVPFQDNTVLDVSSFHTNSSTKVLH